MPYKFAYWQLPNHGKVIMRSVLLTITSGSKPSAIVSVTPPSPLSTTIWRRRKREQLPGGTTKNGTHSTAARPTTHSGWKTNSHAKKQSRKQRNANAEWTSDFCANGNRMHDPNTNARYAKHFWNITISPSKFHFWKFLNFCSAR